MLRALGMLRTISLLLALAAAGRAHAGELDVAGTLEGTSTAWREDRAGGGTLRAAWFVRPWIAPTFVGKTHYASVDDRVLSYVALGATVRRSLGRVRVLAGLGLVHQHEEPRVAIDAQPLASLLGVGDGIRHRAGARAGLAIAVPLRRHRRGDVYAAVSLDATRFGDDHGPRWQASAGVGVGVTVDWGR